MDITKIKLTIQQVANSDTVLITDVRELKEFVDNKVTDKTIGWIYSVVAPANKYAGFSIKVNDLIPAITKEDLEAKGGTVKAKVKGYEGTIYKDRTVFIKYPQKPADWR